MLGLQLRDEFLGSEMPGTAITLRTNDNQGAVQKSPDYILSITYPTGDVQTALKAVSTKRTRKPIVIMGDRGSGKSHIMAVLHHAIGAPQTVETWLKNWGTLLDSDTLKQTELLKGYLPISEPVHNHEYPLLWNLLFDRHPRGQYYRGQFEHMNQPYPPRSLLEQMFEDQPTCLILDEFQTWFTGLPDIDPKSGLHLRVYAFNFIQNLSEIAKDRPEILVFVISLLDNQNDAFAQIHRQGPILIDFRGPTAKQDRQKLLLHRLFANRRHIAEADIMTTCQAYAAERLRLLHTDASEAEKERLHDETFACWPFSPELLELLENHILLSYAAQETRDLIRILAQVFRTRGAVVPVITPADFFVDGTTDEVQTLVDSIAVQAGQEKLRQIAQRNLEAVRHVGVDVPHARELVSSIWMRSMSPGKHAGGTPAQLHLDITRGTALDDNAFQAELALLIENSFNIHGDETSGERLWFSAQENIRSKVRASAKNNKLWHITAVSTAGQTVYPGKDVLHIRKTLRKLFDPDISSSSAHIVILGPNWQSDPWCDIEDAGKPEKWDRPVLLVVPDQIDGSPAGLNATLGTWLATHVQKRRNTIRFLLLAKGAKGLFADQELLFVARCSFLSSREAWGKDNTYYTLHRDFNKSLDDCLKARYNRFAVLRTWNFQHPQSCVFDVEKISEQGGNIPKAVEETIRSNLFDMNDFREFVLKHARESKTLGDLLDELSEAPPSVDAIPFLGETEIQERVLKVAASGDLVLNVGNTWIGRRPEDATEEAALRFLTNKAFKTGKELRQIQLGLPGAVGGGTISVSNDPPKGSSNSGTSGHTPQTGGDTGTQDTTPRGGGENPVKVIDDPNETPSTGETPPPTEPATITEKTETPSTGLNLSGLFEKWGIQPGQTLETAQIAFTGLTVQQIRQILQKMPSAYKATLEITYQKDAKPKDEKP